MTTAFDSIDSIINSLYTSISGPAGAPRDWDLQQSLFHPAARSMRTGVDERDRPWLKAMTATDYAEDTTPFFVENDFYEIEIARQVQRFGNVAGVRSVYEARKAPDDGVLLKRGVNFIHLFHDGSRWWVMNIIWDNERLDLAIPPDWLIGG